MRSDTQMMEPSSAGVAVAIRLAPPATSVFWCHGLPHRLVRAATGLMIRGQVKSILARLAGSAG